MKRLPLVVLAIGNVVATLAATAQSHSGSQMKTYVSADGDFQFRYADWLIDCKAHLGSSSCASYIPVCDGESYESVACVAYPKDRVKEQQTFDGAAFAVVIVKDAQDDNGCHQIPEPPPPHLAHVHTKTMNGIEFWVIENVGGAALGHSNNMTIYRSFNNSVCYELDINVSGTSAMLYPDRPKPFDSNEVEEPLRETLKTFQFLK
jgi:hypothetical protein